MIPHETPIPGPAADFADRLAALVPVLETPRLRLRAPRLGDMPAWAEVFMGPSAQFLGGHVTGSPEDRDGAFTEFAATAALWLLRGHGPWAVETREGEVMGFVLIGFEPGDREPELGYLFLPKGEGKGYAFEAATAARDWALGPMRLPSLVSYIDPANARSRRLAQRLGAWRDGSVDGCEVWRHAPLSERPH